MKGEKEHSIRIDEILSEIYDSEAPELPGFLEKERQERLEARIMAGIRELQEKEAAGNLGNEENSRLEKKRGRRRTRRVFVLGFAAVLLLGLCLVSFASSNPDLDIEILQFMGLDESDTVQLESGEVEIQVYDSCLATEYKSGADGQRTTKQKEVKIMAVNSIGDKNSACIRIETDYEFPEGYDVTTDYILPEHNRIDIYEKEGSFVESTMGSTMGYMNDDGKLGYMIYITGCKNLNKSRVVVSFKDFYLYHDLGMEEGGEEEELLLEGEWKLEWKYAYKSNTNVHKMLKQIEIDGVKYYITNVEVSPLSVQIDGFRMPWNREEKFDGFTIDRINYRDGSSLDVGGFSSGGNRNGIWMNGFVGTTKLGTTIDVEKVESIVIGGNEVVLK